MEQGGWSREGTVAWKKGGWSRDGVAGRVEQESRADGAGKVDNGDRMMEQRELEWGRDSDGGARRVGRRKLPLSAVQWH